MANTFWMILKSVVVVKYAIVMPNDVNEVSRATITEVFLRPNLIIRRNIVLIV